jgi:hypothetical protein
MSKDKNKRKDQKKKAVMSIKEKRALKKLKRAERESDNPLKNARSNF